MDERYRSLPLNPLRAFAIASRHRSFAAAARHMGVSQVAISRQIGILETYLGVKLFERSSQSVKLTDIGRAFGHEIAALFDGIEHATNRILTDEVDATISVRVYPSFLQHWLMPRLTRFQAAWPQYRVRFDTIVAPLDFRSTYLDLAIQLGRGPWRDARSQPLFDEVVDAVCSPLYAQSILPQIEQGHLEGVEILQSRYRRQEWEIWAARTGVRIGGDCPVTEFDSSLLTYGAARQGLGLAIGQLALLRTELANQELVRPFRREVETGAAFHAVWPATKSLGIKTRRFLDWLAAEAGTATAACKPAAQPRPAPVTGHYAT